MVGLANTPKKFQNRIEKCELHAAILYNKVNCIESHARNALQNQKQGTIKRKDPKKKTNEI